MEMSLRTENAATTLKSSIEVAISKKRSQWEYTQVLNELLVDTNDYLVLLHIFWIWHGVKADSYENMKDTVDIASCP
jgi:hypothetical protein